MYCSELRELMMSMMCGVELNDRKSNMELMAMVGSSEGIVTLVRRST